MVTKGKVSAGNSNQSADPSSYAIVRNQLSSCIQVVILVEADSDVSPYIYHINDQPPSDIFFVLNDKKILKSVKSRESITTEPMSESLKQDERNSTLEMVQAIQVELAKIEKIHCQPNSTTTLSSLVKRGKFRAPDNSPSESYVLISTMYDPNLPKLLIESNVPVRAIIRLVEDAVTSQQTEYTYFYENYLKQYPFRNKMKRNIPRLSGKCQEDTNELSKKIETFWKSLNIIRKENSLLFHNTIFVDCETPYVDLGSCKGNLRVTLESYCHSLYEDIRSVQIKIRGIARAHQCYSDRMRLQNLRTLNTLKIDTLTRYKEEILTSGSNIPCIVYSITEQVDDLKTGSALSDSKSTFLEESSNMAIKSKVVMTEELNAEIYHLKTFLFELTNTLDDYYFVHDTPQRINIIHARDGVRLSSIEHLWKPKTYETTMMMLKTYVRSLTQNYLPCSMNDYPTKLRDIDHAKSFINKKLIDPTEKSGSVDEFASKSFNNKKFYLSYYLSLPLLELRYITRNSFSDNIKLESVASTSVHEDYNSYCNMNNSFEEISSELDVKAKHVIKIKEILKQIEASSLIQHVQAKFNYTENFTPDSMIQLVLSRVSSADHVTLTRLPITGDLLIQCLNESCDTTEHKFSIPTYVGLSDFYHVIMEERYVSILGDLLLCPTPDTPSSQPSSDRCHSSMFLPPDSIKYEQSITHSNSIENESSKANSTAETSDQEFTHLGYKYGTTQYVENKSSVMVRWFDKNIKLKIEKNTWAHKHMEYISVACHIRSYRTGDITEAKDHVMYYHIKRDIIQAHIVNADFRMNLKTDMQIYFKNKSLFNSPDLLSESDELLNYENSFKSVDSANLWIAPTSLDSTDDLIYDQSMELVHKFALFSPKYFPILCCPNGLTVDITNESAFPFCIQQYFTGRDVFPIHIRKYLLNACVLSSGQMEDDIMVMSSTGEMFLANKSNLFRDDGTVNWTMQSPEGDLYTVQEGKTTLIESSSLKVTVRENFEDNSLFLKREDGLVMHFCEDSTLDVVYPDGTHFTTNVLIEDIKDGYLLVSISVQVSHSDYFTVLYNYSEASLTLSNATGFELKILTNGSYKFHLDDASSAHVDAEYLVWEMKDVMCGDVMDKFEVKLGPITPDTTLISLHNAQSELKVDATGHVSANPKHSSGCEEVSLSDQVSMASFYSELFNSDLVNDPHDASSFLILSPDFSGFEILHSASVESLLTLVRLYQKKYPDSIVLQALDSLHPYYSTFIAHTLSEGSDKVSSPGDPSTYGTSWWHPFQRKVDTSCPSPSTRGWIYRLLHRVNRTMEDIIQLFLQALEVTEVADIKPQDYGREGEDMMERICRGNVILKSVKERDVAFIRKFVDHMVGRAVLLFNIESVHRQNRLLLDILSHRPKLGKQKKVCQKEKPSCKIQEVRKCFVDD